MHTSHIAQSYDLRWGPEPVRPLSKDVMYHMLTFLLPRDVFAVEQVCRAFRSAIHPIFWQQTAEKIRIFVRKSLKKNIIIFYRIQKSDQQEWYFFSLKILKNLSPIQFWKMPAFLIPDLPTTFLPEWKPATNKTLIGRGIYACPEYEAPFVAFSIYDHKIRRRVNLIVLKSEGDLSPAKQQYIARLLKGKPCGSWDFGKDRETAPLAVKRNGKMQSVVQLKPADIYELRAGWIPHSFVYWGKTALTSGKHTSHLKT